jgi:RNA polymerase sigma-70 factor (ECF subfamily)
VSAGTADEDRGDIARVLAGDREAYAALVERHHGRLVGHLRRLVGASDADDLAQEALVRAYQALERYDPRYPFRGWLLVIATRLAANHAARRRERPLGDAAVEVPERRGNDPAATLAEDDAAAVLAGRIDRAVAGLADDAKALYELRFRQELGVSELARHFELSENAVKVRIHRLRAALARCLGLTLAEEA